MMVWSEFAYLLTLKMHLKPFTNVICHSAMRVGRGGARCEAQVPNGVDPWGEGSYPLSTSYRERCKHPQRNPGLMGRQVYSFCASLADRYDVTFGLWHMSRPSVTTVTLLHPRERLEVFGNIFAPLNSSGTRTVSSKSL